MSRSFSTEPLPASDRMTAWQWQAHQICGDCRVRFPKHYPFHGSIDVRTIGDLELMRFSSSPLSFVESPSESAYSKTYCIVITQLEGVRSYSQDGVAVILQPGDGTLIDCGRTWSSRCSWKSARLYLRVPRWLLENRLRTSTLPIAQRIPGDAGIGATLFRLTTSLYHEAEILKPEEGAAALDAYFDILSACVGHSETDLGGERHSTELCARIRRFMEAHLAEPTLGPVEIASAAGISVRHLHRLFSLRGHTVGDWIRERRLEHCRRDIADPRLRARTITDIAFFWGFSDSAHFSRSFKQRFGISPRVFRALAWPKSGNLEKTGGLQDFQTPITGPHYPKPN